MTHGSVLITGAGGFVGRHLCAELASADWCVRGAIRREISSSYLPKTAQPSRITDPASAASWASILDGVDVVVHLVARSHAGPVRESDVAAYREVNVGITRALLEACLISNISRFLYLSSVKAVGEGAPTAYDESTACKPEDVYGATKREAEVLVANTAEEASIDAVVLRAPLIYGPGVKGNFLEILKLVNRRCPFPIGGIHNARSMLFVGNLTSAISALLRSERFPESLFHVADPGPPLSTQDLVRDLAQLMGRKVAVFPVPQALLRLGGRLLGRQDLVSRLTDSLTVSSERIQRVLGWHAPFSVSEGLSRTVDWYLTGSRGGKR